jgi:copper homeostasis protein (lipoprotein)
MQKHRIAAVALILAGALGLAGLVTRVAASSAEVVSPETTPLEGTFWQAVWVGDKQIRLFALPGPYLVFERTGRVTGSNGCNRLVGDFDLNEEVVTFARIESTHMMCVNYHDVDRMFDQALNNARRLVIVGNQLQLFDSANRPLVIFHPAM